MTNEYYHRIQHIWVSLDGTKASLEQNCKKKKLPVLNRTKEHEDRIHYIWVSLSTKIHLARQSCFLEPKVLKKGISCPKHEKMNITVKFDIFQLV